jgi:hypothetical protein
MKVVAPPLVALTLSACATAKLHDQQALDTVALGCGLTYGNLIQDAEEKRLLITLRNDLSYGQRACLVQWARANHLKTVFVDMETPQS